MSKEILGAKKATNVVMDGSQGTWSQGTQPQRVQQYLRRKERQVPHRAGRVTRDRTSKGRHTHPRMEIQHAPHDGEKVPKKGPAANDQEKNNISCPEKNTVKATIKKIHEKLEKSIKQ